MWILILILAIFVLKNIMSSHNAANAVTPPSTPVTLLSGGGSGVGDTFTGCTIAAGVCEPVQPSIKFPITCSSGGGNRATAHCCHILVTHFPVDPPPIKIQTKYPTPVRPPVQPIHVGGPIFECGCGMPIGLGGGGSGSKGGTGRLFSDTESCICMSTF